MKNHVKILLCALSLGASLWAVAQTTQSESAVISPPVRTSAPAQELNYQSAFADYKPYQDLKPGDWRAANDTVGKTAGDHSGRATGMTSQHPPPAPPSAHTGHHMDGGQK